MALLLVSRNWFEPSAFVRYISRLSSRSDTKRMRSREDGRGGFTAIDGSMPDAVAGGADGWISSELVQANPRAKTAAKTMRAFNHVISLLRALILHIATTPS